MHIYARKIFLALGNQSWKPVKIEVIDMRENVVERALVVEVKARGGIAVKFVSPGLDGVPDRLVLFPNGKIVFVELKAPGKKMRPLQVKRKRQLESFGFKVYCIDSRERIEVMLDEICTT